MKKLITLFALLLIFGFTKASSVSIGVTATQGTLGGSYTSLKLAFDKINDGTHRGTITVTINTNTTETASAVLNASGSASASYTSVNIYPTTTGLSITGDLSTPLIDLNGADNVTIDGRVNATGSAKDLVLTNISTSPLNTASTIRFYNDASSNTIKYCTIKGSTTALQAGILFFSTTTVTTGNDGNIIDNNNITNATDANRPVNAIYSKGTSYKENSGNTISNNNIYDFLNRGINSYGINLQLYTTAWTISDNSFYEIASFVPTKDVAYKVINILNTSGINFTVSNNYIGGNSSLCGGTWTKTNAFNSVFYGIYLEVGSNTASNVMGNTIKNFTYGNPEKVDWYGIYVSAGDVNIGTTTGNVIGSGTGTGSITFTAGQTDANFYGIYLSTTGVSNVQKNTVGSITVSNIADNATNFYGIYKFYTQGTTTISNNLIGSTTDANSINASSAYNIINR